MNIDKFKAAFVRRHNPAGTREAAINASITAAVKRNTLYKEKITPHEIIQIKTEWSNQLSSIIDKIESSYSELNYEEDIINLKNHMNSKLSSLFRSEVHKTFHLDPGFRISHAQKSISVALKHLWCLGLLKIKPPQCPVDSTILNEAGLYYKKSNWGCINSIEEHRRKIVHLKNAVLVCNREIQDKKQTIIKGHKINTPYELSLSEWELIAFTSISELI